MAGNKMLWFMIKIQTIKEIQNLGNHGSREKGMFDNDKELAQV